MSLLPTGMRILPQKINSAAVRRLMRLVLTHRDYVKLGSAADIRLSKAAESIL